MFHSTGFASAWLLPDTGRVTLAGPQDIEQVQCLSHVVTAREGKSQ